MVDVETSLDFQGLLHAILTCVTAGPGLGFNRAMLFLADDAERQLVAAMAIGPASPEEAHATARRLQERFPGSGGRLVHSVG